MTGAAPRAAILAVGTELTTGQVTNRNAAWISERLVELGIEVVLHETVADDRAAIRAALERCAGLAALLFVTGGLGPTSDDFTREIVAEWAGQPLEFDPGSWNAIETRLSRFGVRVAESNRQQCYYPRGARVIANPRGTACAFAIIASGTSTWVLPGPPAEVEACWASGIPAQLLGALPPGAAPAPRRLLTWQCLGKSEAELGELTEKALEGSGLETGYRAHRPFIEIKVWVPEAELARARPHLDRLEASLGPWIASRMGEDPARRLLAQLARSEELELSDSLSGGLLGERLGPLLRLPEHESLADGLTLVTFQPEGGPSACPDPQASIELLLTQADPETLTLGISGFSSDGKWTIGLCGPQSKIETLGSPFRVDSPETVDRARRYAVEKAILVWADWLAQSIN